MGLFPTESVSFSKPGIPALAEQRLIRIQLRLMVTAITENPNYLGLGLSLGAAYRCCVKNCIWIRINVYRKPGTNSRKSENSA